MPSELQHHELTVTIDGRSHLANGARFDVVEPEIGRAHV